MAEGMAYVPPRRKTTLPAVARVTAVEREQGEPTVQAVPVPPGEAKWVPRFSGVDTTGCGPRGLRTGCGGGVGGVGVGAVTTTLTVGVTETPPCVTDMEAVLVPAVVYVQEKV